MENRTIYNVSCFALLVVVIGVLVIAVIVDDIPNFCCVAAVLIAVLGIPLQFWYDKIKEKTNPLNFKKCKKALLYAVDTERGMKDDFVRENSTEMYEHFLDMGFIHEFADGDVFRWEVTRYGKRRKKEIFS